MLTSPVIQFPTKSYLSPSSHIRFFSSKLNSLLSPFSVCRLLPATVNGNHLYLQQPRLIDQSHINLLESRPRPLHPCTMSILLSLAEPQPLTIIPSPFSSLESIKMYDQSHFFNSLYHIRFKQTTSNKNLIKIYNVLFYKPNKITILFTYLVDRLS